MSQGLRGALSSSFPTSCAVRQGCPISPFLFNFVIDTLMEACMAALRNTGLCIAPNDRILDLDYADDIVLLFDSFDEAQAPLTR